MLSYVHGQMLSYVQEQMLPCVKDQMLPCVKDQMLSYVQGQMFLYVKSQIFFKHLMLPSCQIMSYIRGHRHSAQLSCLELDNLPLIMKNNITHCNIIVK
jgi:hypothetical protein